MLPAELLGVYLNPDEIEAKIRQHKILSIADFGVTPDTKVAARIYAFFNQSKFLHDVGLSEEVGKLRAIDGQIDFSDVVVNSYFASVVADFLRQELMKQKVSFTLETVMSSPDKVACWKGHSNSAIERTCTSSRPMILKSTFLACRTE